jgi:MFS family permease
MAGESREAVVAKAVRYLLDTYSPSGTRVGWLMIATIFIEAWDLYSISFVLIFIGQVFHPSAWAVGLVGAATQGGAVIGALLGGWLSDRVGRRAIFLGTMIMFTIVGIAQSFSPNMATLIVIRFLLGVPLGSDISNSYTYIMESMPSGQREVMGNRWQFMFAFGEVVAIAVVAVLTAIGMPADLLWRVILGLGAVPALAIFLLRFKLPETAVWLIQRGRFREAKRVTRELYGDSLAILPDRDVEIPHPKLRVFFQHLRGNSVRWRATLFGWLACFAQSSEFSTFGFYIPMLFVTLGISSPFGTSLVTLCLYIVAAISGYVGPLITPRIGQRMLSIYGFSIVFVSLIVAALAIYADKLIIVPFAAAAMLWGHYWDAENVMTIPAMVAQPVYRGTAAGVAYVFVKLPSFLSIFLFPAFFGAIGKANATLFTALFPLVGLLAATFILPEVYGYKEDAQMAA